MLGQTSDASISVRLGFGRWQHRRSPKCTQYGIYNDDLGRIERTSATWPWPGLRNSIKPDH